MSFAVLAALFLLLFPTNAQAACASPAGGAGAILYNSDQHIMQYCNNTNWIGMGGTPSTAGCGACTCASPAGAQGTMVYNNDFHIMQYCNGTSWIAMGTAGTGASNGAEGRIVASGGRGCGVLADGTARCWGDASSGQLGNGATSPDQPSPVTVNGGYSWQSVTASANGHTCGIRTNGVAMCWGVAGNGQLGDGQTATNQSSPVTVLGGYAWQAISAGIFHTCGVRTNGVAMCWGAPFNGQLGDGQTATNQSSPVTVLGGHTWQSIAGGQEHSCGIRTDGVAMCWGREFYGALGNGQTASTQTSPVTVLGGHTWGAISLGPYHSCGIRTDGVAMCWGEAANGRLGDGQTATDQSSPVEVLGGHTWRSISAGSSHTCGVRTDGVAMCWGSAANGRLGDGQTGTDQSSPVTVLGGHTWQVVSAGSHTCGLRTDGVAMCWGGSANGRLGNNTTTPDQSSPVLIVDAGAGGPVVQTFNANGTWVKPTGYSSTVDIECWGSGGGGGGGGGGSTTATAGGGGGSGAYKTVNVTIASLGATETVTIGAVGGGGAGAPDGGGAGSTGTAGGNAVFGAVVTANGGSPGGGGVGSGSTQGAGGAGGSCSGCTTGGSGADSTGTGASTTSGAGGNAPAGGGTGGAGEAYTGSAGTPGNPGGAPGAGGGGGGSGKTGNPAAAKAGGIGGAGASGRCVATVNGTSSYVSFLDQGWLGSGCFSPSGVEGSIVYNNDYNKLQFCNGTNWSAFGQ